MDNPPHNMLPIACRLVQHDQWLLTHVDPTWKIRYVKMHLLARCLGVPVPAPVVPHGPQERPASPITFAPDPRHRPVSPIQFADMRGVAPFDARRRRFARRGSDSQTYGEDGDADVEWNGGEEGYEEDDEWDDLDLDLGLNNDLDDIGGGLVAGHAFRAGATSGLPSPTSTPRRYPGRNRNGNTGERVSSPAKVKPKEKENNEDDGCLSPHLYTLIRYSTGQTLEDDFLLSWYGMSSNELVELHGDVQIPPNTLDQSKQVTTIRSTSSQEKSRMRIVAFPRTLSEYVQPYWEGWVRVLRVIGYESVDHKTSLGGHYSAYPAMASTGSSTGQTSLQDDVEAFRKTEADLNTQPKLRQKGKTKLEWRQRWVVIRNGELFLCRDELESSATHRVPLQSITSLRGVEHLARSTQAFQTRTQRPNRPSTSNAYSSLGINALSDIIYSKDRPHTAQTSATLTHPLCIPSRNDPTYIPQSIDEAQRAGFKIVCVRYRYNTSSSSIKTQPQREEIPRYTSTGPSLSQFNNNSDKKKPSSYSSPPGTVREGPSNLMSDSSLLVKDGKVRDTSKWTDLDNRLEKGAEDLFSTPLFGPKLANKASSTKKLMTVVGKQSKLVKSSDGSLDKNFQKAAGKPPPNQIDIKGKGRDMPVSSDAASGEDTSKFSTQRSKLRIERMQYPDANAPSTSADEAMSPKGTPGGAQLVLSPVPADDTDSSPTLSSPVFAHSSGTHASDSDGFSSGFPPRERAGYRYGGYHYDTHISGDSGKKKEGSAGWDESRMAQVKVVEREMTNTIGETRDKQRLGHDPGPKVEEEKDKPIDKSKEKSEWIVLDLHSDSAYQSLLRILHRHFVPPISSSFLKSIPVLLSNTSTRTSAQKASSHSVVNSTPPSVPASISTPTPTETTVADKPSHQPQLSSSTLVSSENTVFVDPANNISEEQAVGEDSDGDFYVQSHAHIGSEGTSQKAQAKFGQKYAHPSVLSTFSNAVKQRPKSKKIRHKSYGALEYPEWRRALVRRARKAGLGTAGGPTELMLLGKRAVRVGGEKWELYGAGDEDSESETGNDDESDIFYLEDDKNAAVGDENTTVQDSMRQRTRRSWHSYASTIMDTYSLGIHVHPWRRNSSDSESTNSGQLIHMSDSDESSEAEWHGWAADLPRQTQARNAAAEQRSKREQERRLLIEREQERDRERQRERELSGNDDPSTDGEYPPRNVWEERRRYWEKRQALEPSAIIFSPYLYTPDYSSDFPPSSTTSSLHPYHTHSLSQSVGQGYLHHPSYRALSTNPTLYHSASMNAGQLRSDVSDVPVRRPSMPTLATSRVHQSFVMPFVPGSPDRKLYIADAGPSSLTTYQFPTQEENGGAQVHVSKQQREISVGKQGGTLGRSASALVKSGFSRKTGDGSKEKLKDEKRVKGKEKATEEKEVKDKGKEKEKEAPSKEKARKEAKMKEKEAKIKEKEARAREKERAKDEKGKMKFETSSKPKLSLATSSSKAQDSTAQPKSPAIQQNARWILRRVRSGSSIKSLER